MCGKCLCVCKWRNEKKNEKKKKNTRTPNITLRSMVIKMLCTLAVRFVIGTKSRRYGSSHCNWKCLPRFFVWKIYDVQYKVNALIHFNLDSIAVWQSDVRLRTWISFQFLFWISIIFFFFFHSSFCHWW